MKKIFPAACLTLAVALTLCACGPKESVRDHQWKNATCEAPETCVRCGETRGEPLGHSFAAAGCVTPETCTRCGGTRGEPLGHALIPADYQSAAVCTRCGASVGEPLTPEFETHGLSDALLSPGDTATVTLRCLHEDLPLTGTVSVSELSVFASDETHPARDGFEWRSVTLEIVFDDENAYYYGIGGVTGCNEDYYGIVLHDKTLQYDASDPGVSTYTVLWNGEEYECERREAASFSDWDGFRKVLTYRFDALVPVGYDGVVVGVSPVLDWPAGAHIYDVFDAASFALVRLA